MIRALALLSLFAATPVAAQRPLTWQKAIRADDRPRLATVWNAWTRALNQIETGGMAAERAALGVLVDPMAKHDGGYPAPGSYVCRTIAMGKRDDGRVTNVPPMVIGVASPCQIVADAGVLRLEQGPGAQRIAGRLFPDGDRMVFLGSKALAGEPGIRAYGRDPDRDQVGVLHSFAPGRWRLELPWPKWQSNLELVEISVP